MCSVFIPFIIQGCYSRPISGCRIKILSLVSSKELKKIEVKYFVMWRHVACMEYEVYTLSVLIFTLVPSRTQSLLSRCIKFKPVKLFFFYFTFLKSLLHKYINLSNITSNIHTVAMFVIVGLQTVFHILHTVSPHQISRAWHPGSLVIAIR
jgi:hypothetical protein